MQRVEPTSKHKKLTHSLLLCLPMVLGSVTSVNAQTSVEEVVRTALENNPEMQAKWHDFRSAGHATTAARAGFRPDVNINAGYGRQRENFITGGPLSTGFAEIAMTQMLWDGGRTRANVEEFNSVELVSYFELLESAESTALEAMRAYLDVLRRQELLRLAEENLEVHRTVFDQVAESASAGVARTADLEQINGRLALAEANVITEYSNLHDVTARYLRIVGDMPPSQLRQVQLEHGLPGTIHEVLLQAYQHSPTYHATLRNIEASEAFSRGQQSATRPRLQLTARYGVEDRDEFGSRQSHTDGRIGIELTYDLYSGGRNRANINRAYELENTARSLRDKACVDIRQTVQIAFNDMQKIAQQLPILNQHRLSSDRVRTAYKQQFDIGQRTLLDVLDSENEFFEASRAWTNASYDETLAAARTLAAMGLLLETLSVGRTDIPSLAELGAEPMPVDPTTACPLPQSVRQLAMPQRPAPVTPAPAPVVATEITLSNQATFALDSAELQPAARETLSQVIAAIREGGLVGRIQVVGHTCDLGPADHNQGLSERRAEAVVDYLRSAGIGADEISWEGRGENEPRYPNDSEQNRSRNRRVEITFVTERATTQRIPVSPDGPITEVRQMEVSSEAPSLGQTLPPSAEYSVQLGSFSVEANATALVKQLKAQDFDAYMVQTEVREQTIWLVRVRASDGRESAIALRQKLSSETGLNDLIVIRSA